MECRHPSSLSSTIGPPHSHFVNRPVVTKRLTYSAATVASVNDTRIVPRICEIYMHMQSFLIHCAVIKNIVILHNLFYAKFVLYFICNVYRKR